MKSLFRYICLLNLLLLTACTSNKAVEMETNKEKVQLEFFTPKIETEPIFDEFIHEFLRAHLYMEWIATLGHCHIQ